MRLGVARAISGGAVVEGDVEIDGATVSAVGTSPAGPGGIAVPGFVDMQVNGFAGVDFTTATAEDYATAGAAMLATGVVAYQPTLITLPSPDTTAALRTLAEIPPDAAGPRIIGMHLEGPFLSPVRAGAHDPVSMIDPDPDLAAGFLSAGPVTMLTLAPERPGALEVIDFLVAKGVAVACGHSDATAAEAHAAFENSSGNPAAAPNFVVDQDADLIDENSGSGGGLTIDYTFNGGHMLTSITGVRTVDRKVGSDEDATRTFTLDARYFEDDFDHITQELRLASPEDQAFRYVVGAFYFDQDAKTDRVVALGPGFGGPPEGVDAAIQDSSVDTTNVALFVNGDLDLSDKWTLGAGLRYTDESKDARIDQFVFPGFGLAELIQESFTRDEDYVTATLNLQYQATDDVLAYFTYSNGYKAGGFNVDLVPTVEDLLFDEETVDSFEVGLKTDLLDGRLRLNVTAFHAEYADYQVFQFRFDPFSGTTALLVSNAASVTTKGLEIEGVARFTDNFELSYGVGLTDATFDDFPGGAVDPGTGESINVAGNTLPRAPDVTASLTARYLFSAGSIDGSAVLNFTHRGEQYFNPDNRENSRQDAYSLVNASVDLDINENWSVGIWGRNLTDEVYRGMRGVSFLGIPFSLYMPPRTYGVEAAFRF